MSPPLLFRERVEALLQLGQTQRWHTEAGRTVKTQDVAQHVYNIQWLVYVLNEGHPSAELMIAALAHDGGERYSGDMPSPAKRKMKLGPAFDAYELERLEELGVKLPTLSARETQQLGFADALEGCCFCAREVALGNRLIERAYRNFMLYADAKADVNSAIQLTLLQHVKDDYAKHFEPERE